MRVTHIITRLVIGGAQENTVATVLGLRQKSGVEVSLISGPTSGPEGTLEPEIKKNAGLLTLVPELVRPVHPLKDFIALRKLEKILREQKPHIVHTHRAKLESSDASPPGAQGFPSSSTTSMAPRSGTFRAGLPTWYLPPPRSTPPG